MVLGMLYKRQGEWGATACCISQQCHIAHPSLRALEKYGNVMGNAVIIAAASAPFLKIWQSGSTEPHGALSGAALPNETVIVSSNRPFENACRQKCAQASSALVRLCSLSAGTSKRRHSGPTATRATRCVPPTAPLWAPPQYTATYDRSSSRANWQRRTRRRSKRSATSAFFTRGVFHCSVCHFGERRARATGVERRLAARCGTPIYRETD